MNEHEIMSDARFSLETPTASGRVFSTVQNVLVVPLGMTLDQIEREVIYQTLKRTNGNKQAAARALGIYRPRLYSKIKKYRLTEFM